MLKTFKILFSSSLKEEMVEERLLSVCGGVVAEQGR
jgi:hypothetical protein